jgi:hypothetical protein
MSRLNQTNFSQKEKNHIRDMEQVVQEAKKETVLVAIYVIH